MVFANITNNPSSRYATLTAIGAIAFGTSLLPLSILAQIVSFTLLIVFTIVHASALKLIQTKQLATLAAYTPIIEILLNCRVIILQISQWL